MKNILIIFTLCIGGWLQLQGQQIHQLTQYTLNDFAFNPAIAGYDVNRVVTKASFRKQWLGGFDGQEPTTFLVSGHTNFSKKKNIGLGMMIFADQTGPTSRLGLNLAYAYHIPLDGYDRKHNLALGISGTLMQYTINFDELVLTDVGDAGAVASASNNDITADANFGAYLYGPKYWVSLSALQLVRSQVVISERSVTADEASVLLSRHFYLGGGYRFKAADDIVLEPSALLKYVQAVPLSFEANLRAFYRGEYWAGLGYRHHDAFSIMLGIQLENGLNVAYSYDIISSNIRRVSSGSHEITLGYNFKWERDALRAKPFNYDSDL